MVIKELSNALKKKAWTTTNNVQFKKGKSVIVLEYRLDGKKITQDESSEFNSIKVIRLEDNRLLLKKEEVIAELVDIEKHLNFDIYIPLKEIISAQDIRTKRYKEILSKLYDIDFYFCPNLKSDRKEDQYLYRANYQKRNFINITPEALCRNYMKMYNDEFYSSMDLSFDEAKTDEEVYGQYLKEQLIENDLAYYVGSGMNTVFNCIMAYVYAKKMQTYYNTQFETYGFVDENKTFIDEVVNIFENMNSIQNFYKMEEE